MEKNFATDEYMPKIVAKRADLFRRQATRLDVRRTQEKLSLLKQGFTILEDYGSNDKIIVDHMVDIIVELLHSYLDRTSLEYAFEKLKLHLKKMRKSAKFKSITAHLKSLNARTNLDILKNIEALLIDVNEYLHLLNSDEAIVTAIKDGYGFCKNQEKTGIYFTMVGLPADLTEGDILGNYNLFESKGGPRLINPHKVGNIYERISNVI